jgi:hypothetical protein
MNTSLKLDEQYRYIHSFLVSRIYHEDLLLSQRTYNFVTINTFLVTALAITFLNSPESVSGLPYIISIFGIFFTFLHLSLGRATERAITFWREYLRVLENVMQLKLDSAMFEFYKKGTVDTGFDIVISNPQKEENNAENNSMPKQIGLPLAWIPSFLSSTNIWVGVLIPWLVATFWFSIIVILLYRAGKSGMICLLVMLFVSFFVATWFSPFAPSIPVVKSK